MRCRGMRTSSNTRLTGRVSLAAPLFYFEAAGVTVMHTWAVQLVTLQLLVSWLRDATSGMIPFCPGWLVQEFAWK